MPTLTTDPWDDAIARFDAKTVVGSRLRTEGWRDLPQALREGAFFSAGVEHARTLGAMRAKILAGLRQEHDGTGMNRARFVAEMRGLLGTPEGDSGRLTDLGSRRRLELIWDFQQADAHGYAAHQAGLDPDLLDAFPAQRLIRLESRRVERVWFTRWGAAGAQVAFAGASRTAMVALKTSPIWAALSEFGRAWPPFDWGSGMGLEEVDRDEAEAAGLLDLAEPPAERLRRLRDEAAGATQRWQDQLQASTRGLDEPVLGWLRRFFGDQVELDPGSQTVRWRGAR